MFSDTIHVAASVNFNVDNLAHKKLEEA